MEMAYRRFIILSNARTGSNLVQQALNSHPQVVCFRELFNYDPAYIDYDVEGWDGHDAGDLALRSADIDAFLRTRVFCEHAEGVRAVGFKFHYDHFWFHERLLPWLAEDAGLHVVHLKRLNRLRTLVSFKIAEQTGEWLRHDEMKQRSAVIKRKLSAANIAHAATHPLESIQRVRRFLQPVNRPLTTERRALTLTVEECDAFFYKVGHEEGHFGRVFEGHPTIEITYEDLASDRGRVLADLESFLGVSRAPLSTTLRRQNPEPLHELVANYDELRSHYEGRAEAVYFDG
jgi:LPS sulfotransferase NodH